MVSIATVDLEAADAPQRLHGGLRELGFVALEGHGVDPALVARVHGGFERFFALPEAEKAVCGGRAGGQRGFTPFGVEHARDHAEPDLKEFFHVGPEVEPGSAASAAHLPPNVWPAQVPGLREDCLRLFAALEACAERVLEVLARACGLPSRRLADMIVGGSSLLRALHYPPVAADASRGALRAAAHEDINLVTLLPAATDAGLEIRPPAGGDWIAVDAKPGQIVADSGDMLARLTNGELPATTHRVVQPAAVAERHRYALPFFAHPRPECDLTALPGFVGEGRPRPQPPITAGAYLAERLREIGLTE